MIEHTLEAIAHRQFFLIAGPCVVESKDLCHEVAETIARLCTERAVPYVFKASYKKANRLSKGSFSGPGVEDGLAILKEIRKQHELPILTDVHETIEVADAALVADILQIPAFLCRQTDLVVEAAATGKWVNIKKGQFLAPEDMARLAAKANSEKVMVTERGTTFGYRQLVVDYRSLLIMRETGHPVVFDATHSLQLPGGGGGVSTGQPEYVIPMSRAAVAVGVDGLFVEAHPNPSQALSDANTQLQLTEMERLLDNVLAVRQTMERLS